MGLIEIQEGDWLRIHLTAVAYCPICGQITASGVPRTKEHIEVCVQNSSGQTASSDVVSGELECDTGTQPLEDELISQNSVNDISNTENPKPYEEVLFSTQHLRIITTIENAPECGIDESAKNCDTVSTENTVESTAEYIIPDKDPPIVPSFRTKNQCSECQRSFKSKYQLKQHISQVHENVKAHSCKFCEKSFREKTSLKNHILTHTDERPFPCDKCDKRFRRKESLQYHQQSHNANQTRSFICSICAKPFRNVRDLKAHEKSFHFTSTLDIFCKECNEQFKSKTAFSNHMKLVHGQGTVYTCSHCPRRFPSKSTLENHTRTHTGAKPFGCQYCKKTFRMAYLRDIHEQRHTRSGAFRCQICNTTFPQGSEYRRHLEIHEEKKFCCGMCQQVFRTEKALLKHVDKQHNNQDVKVESAKNEETEDKIINISSYASDPLPGGIEVTSLQLPVVAGAPLQTISVKTEKLRTMDDTITTKTVYVMDPDVPDSDSISHPGVSGIINLPYTIGVPQFRSDKEVGSRIVIPGGAGKYILPAAPPPPDP
eukprot:TRINITY_DN5278_c0_g1_i11.p1 TRINITY_DN5278_c0_g1~~TRINITY_DN5278_c0_g1_i11.p1  ORF type:complete len:542 (-),score=50.84 TRINITY_DN5278_c0_g1_i11:660-2285(-)